MAFTWDRNDTESTVSINTNSEMFDVLLLMYDFSEYMFTPGEVAEKIDVSRETAQGILSQFVSQNLVGNVGGEVGYYYAMEEQGIKEEIRSCLTNEEHRARQLTRNKFQT